MAMHAIQSTLMASLLLIQAMLGLCWHPSRDCACLESSVSTVTVGCCNDQCEGTRDEEPCNCQLECSGICTFIPPEKTRIDSPELAVGLHHLAMSSTPAESQGVSASWAEVAYGPPELKPPPRLHPLPQNLFI